MSVERRFGKNRTSLDGRRSREARQIVMRHRIADARRRKKKGLAPRTRKPLWGVSVVVTTTNPRVLRDTARDARVFDASPIFFSFLELTVRETMTTKVR